MKGAVVCAVMGLLMLLAAVVPFPFGPPRVAAQGYGDLHPERVNVGFFGSVPPNIAARVDSEGGEVLDVNQAIRLVLAKTKPGVSQSLFVTRMLAYADTEYAVPDAVGGLNTAPTDPLYPSQWGPFRIGAEVAWQQGFGDATVKVALLDGGVECTHEDLSGVCHPLSPAPVDPCNGHGTRAAGIIAARVNNAQGVAGLVQTQAYSVAASVNPAIGCSPLVGPFAIELAKLASLAPLGIRVASMSWSWPCGAYPPGTCLPMERAVELAHNAGLLLVASGHNSPCGSVDYPASYPQVIGVGALDAPPNDHRRDPFNGPCGPELDLIAPGVSIISACISTAYNPPYCTDNGTSWATAFVSGVAAYVWGKCPGLSRDTVRSVLEGSAEYVPGEGPEEQGHGVIRMDWSLTAAHQTPGCT